MKRSTMAALAAASWTVPAAAAASDTASYTYDALGRLTDVSVAGGPNAGAAAATRYDPAGNRTSYSVTGAGPAGQAATSQSASFGEAATGLDEEGIAEVVPPSPVEPPPSGGIPDEPEPAGELETPDGDAGARGGAR